MRELAAQDVAAGTVAVTEKQTAGKGRYGRSWSSRQGGLYFTVLERPALTLADYCLPIMRYQIAAARALTAICGKPARLRWPNDIYVDRRKIAGLLADIMGEGDLIKWVSMGIGINVNNQVPTARSISCTGIAGHRVSRRDLLLGIISESEKIAASTGSAAAYSQGNRLLAAQWNSLADGIGARAAVLASGFADGKAGAGDDAAAGGAAVGGAAEGEGRLLARGVFAGVDPAGRCIIKSDNGKETLYFNPGPVSLIF
jgi:BirA family biotin operon repressor/biotin-[acetyl-CoA-carboxylase] ligase